MQFPWILKKPELEEDLILTLNLLYPELHLNYFKNVNFYTNQDSIDRPGCCTYPYYCHGNHNALFGPRLTQIIWVNLLFKLVYELIKKINQPINLIFKKPEVGDLTFNLLYPELHLTYFKIINFIQIRTALTVQAVVPILIIAMEIFNALLDQDWLRIWVNLLSKLVYELIKQTKSVKQPIHFPLQN